MNDKSQDAIEPLASALTEMKQGLSGKTLSHS